MSNKYIFVDNIEELTIIQNKYPELEKIPLILISDNFSSEQINSFTARGYHFFDDFIDDELANSMADKIYEILWGWYKDKEGNDLSVIDGLSLGVTFTPSMEMLLNSIIKYEVAMSRILKSGEEIYFVAGTDNIFIEVIKDISKKIELKIHSIEINYRKRSILYGKTKIDPGSRIRDLLPYFGIYWKRNLFYWLLKVFGKLQKFEVHPDSKRILLFSCGKLNEFIEDKIRNLKSENNLQWILPYNSIKGLIKILFNKIYLTSQYYFLATDDKLKTETSAILSRLEDNITTSVKSISADTLIVLMEKYIFKYVPGVLSYFYNSVEELKYLVPDLVIISSDVAENNLVLTQASRKLGIKTALLPHGIDCWGYKELRVGKQKIVDYCLAFGKKHLMDNLSIGVPAERIVITSFPYFAHFIPVKENKKVRYKKALILTPDFNNLSPGYKTRYFFDYLGDVVRILKEINIEIIGIKSRGEHVYDIHGINNFLALNDQKIPLLSGYSNFSESVKETDLVIGSLSTAVMESGLMGIDYYIMYSKSSVIMRSMLREIEKMMYIAYTADELKENILNKNIYRDGYSVHDFVDLKDVFTKKDLYNKFEHSIERLVRYE